jgi:flagellar protein FlaJ
MANILAQVGYRNATEFILKLALPTMLISLVFFFVTLLLFDLPFYVPYALLFIGFSFIPMYPYIMYERIKINVQEKILLFITFAGTISTIDLDRTTFFKKIIEKEEFGYISKITEKVLYFAKQWNLGFAATCRQLAALCPSKIFADFLDRMAVTLDFGEPLQVFL